MTPFEIVYGFNPNSPLDLTPLPPAEIVSTEGEARAELIKKLHQKAKANIEKKTEGYTKQANKGRKATVFKEGDWVWLHMRPERFPQRRKDKLAPRGDGPFRVLKKINDNAYQLELPGEFSVSPTFNVADLEFFDVGDEDVLRTKPFEEGGNDVDIDPIKDDPREVKDEEGTTQDEAIPHVPIGPITRAKARAIGHKFCQFVDRLMDQVPKTEDEIDHGPWRLLTHQTSASGVFTITQE